MSRLIMKPNLGLWAVLILKCSMGWVLLLVSGHGWKETLLSKMAIYFLYSEPTPVIKRCQAPWLNLVSKALRFVPSSNEAHTHLLLDTLIRSRATGCKASTVPRQSMAILPHMCPLWEGGWDWTQNKRQLQWTGTSRLNFATGTLSRFYDMAVVCLKEHWFKEKLRNGCSANSVTRIYCSKPQNLRPWGWSHGHNRRSVNDTVTHWVAATFLGLLY